MALADRHMAHDPPSGQRLPHPQSGRLYARKPGPRKPGPEGSGREFNVEEVARSAGLSRAHLFRLFQSTLGITPALYFNVLRMEAAFGDLADAEHSITDISGRLGFRRAQPLHAVLPP